MIRSFIAIEIPEVIRKKIYETFAPIRRKTGGVKWIEPSAIHLTLRFLGEVEEEVLEKEVKPRLSEVSSSQKSFPLTLEGVGLFPSLFKPRIFWVGLGGAVLELERLQRKMEDQLVRLPIHQETKAFHPHLTIGRIKVSDRREVWQKILEEYEKIDFGGFQVASLVLFKSELTPRGAIYTQLREFNLE